LRIANFGQHDETGQVLIERTESVVHPRADAGIAAETIAAVHLIHRGRVVHAVHGAAAEEADVVGHLREVRPVFRHVRAALTCFDKLERALHIVAFATLHGRLLLAFAHELLEVHLCKHGLGIEGVDVRRPAFHHQEDDVLRLRGQMAILGRERIVFRFFGEQGGECDAAERGSERIDEIATRGRMQSTSSRTGEIAFNRHKQTRWS
jgi:hypothetical protein